MKEFQSEDSEALMKEIKEHINKWKENPYLMNWEN